MRGSRNRKKDEDVVEVMGEFVNIKMRFFDAEQEFNDEEQAEINARFLNKCIIKVIEDYEAIAATDDSHKDGSMSRCWKILDENETAEKEGVIWSNKRKK